MPVDAWGVDAAWRSRRVGNRHPGGADEPVTDAVTRLEDLDDRRARGTLGQLGLDVHEGLVHVGVELLAGLAETLDAETAERRLELVGDGRERATGEVAGLAGHVDVVEDRQQRLDDAAHRGVTDDLAVAVDALLVVDVLGLQPLEVGEVGRGERVLLRERLPLGGGLRAVVVLVVAAGLGRGAGAALVVRVVAAGARTGGAGGLAAGTPRVGHLGPVGAGPGALGVRGGLGHLASLASSSSTTSASTTSSSAAPAPPAPPAPACAPSGPVPSAPGAPAEAALACSDA